MEEFLLELEVDRIEDYQDLLQNKLISFIDKAFQIKATGYREVVISLRSEELLHSLLMEALRIISLLFFVQVSVAFPGAKLEQPTTTLKTINLNQTCKVKL